MADLAVADTAVKVTAKRDEQLIKNSAKKEDIQRLRDRLDIHIENMLNEVNEHVASPDLQDIKTPTKSPKRKKLPIQPSIE